MYKLRSILLVCVILLATEQVSAKINRPQVVTAGTSGSSGSSGASWKNPQLSKPATGGINKPVGDMINGSFVGQCGCDSTLLPNLYVIRSTLTSALLQNTTTLYQANEASTINALYLDIIIQELSCQFAANSCPYNNSFGQPTAFPVCMLYAVFEKVPNGGTPTTINTFFPLNQGYIQAYQPGNQVLAYKLFVPRASSPDYFMEFEYNGLSDLYYPDGFELHMNQGDRLVLTLRFDCDPGIIVPLQFPGFVYYGTFGWDNAFP
jgi:hypothetical protein